jgi:Tfp pilus assembly protein PilE
MDAAEAGDEYLYRAAVGDSSIHHYLPLFKRFDTPGASRISWNWPSVFVTFFWMLYRRMYGPAVAYFFLWPAFILVLAGILGRTLGPPLSVLIYWSVVIGVEFVAIPMYANALYHRSVKKRIAKLSAGAPSEEAVIQRLIGQRSNAWVVIGVVCVGSVFMTGVLAAIAIPAYQDYAIRSQVVEGLNLAAEVKASVADVYESSQGWPADLAAAGLRAEAFQGKYVESIDVSNGVVLIRYGKAAHQKIAGHTLALQPVSLSTGGVEWNCGYAEQEDVDALALQTDMPPRYLPSKCRSQAGTR